MSEVYFTEDATVVYAPVESQILAHRYRVVLKTYSFVFPLFGKACAATVHRGYLTSGFSFPRALHGLIDRWIGLDHSAVVLHDWLSEYLLIESMGQEIPISQKTVSEIFHLALIEADVPPRIRRILTLLSRWWLLSHSAVKCAHCEKKKELEQSYFYRCDT